MKEEKVNSLIDKILRGQNSTDEQKQVDAWLNERQENKKHFDQISRITQELKHIPIQLNPDTDAEWDSFLNKISSESSEAKVVKLSPMRHLWKVAAMVVLTIGLGWFVNSQLSENSFEVAQEIVIPKGETQVVTLDDGTKVHLNADSKLAVFEKFNEKNRLLKLEGEAYFEVTKNRKLPFIIQTGEVTTEVTGTAFNLSSYPKNNSVHLTVTEGSVDFKTANQKVSVNANTAAVFDRKDQKIEQTPFNADNALAWMEGRLVIKNMTMEEGLAALERRFDVQFIDNSGRTSFEIKVNKDESLDTVLESLKDILMVDIQKEGNVITLSK
jgi:ferric-dicitrate binding protein FerR (iron transport regulator)